MKRCPHCEQEIHDEDNFCRYCGGQVLDTSISEKMNVDMAIVKYQTTGWGLISKSINVAQVKRAKKFNWTLFIFGTLFFLPLALIYLIYYAFERDEIVTLSINEEGHIVEKRNNKVRGFLLIVLVLITICLAYIFYILIQA